MSYTLGVGPYQHEHDGMVLAHTDREHVDPRLLAIIVDGMRRLDLMPSQVCRATVYLDECTPPTIPFVEYDVVRRKPHEDGIGSWRAEQLVLRAPIPVPLQSLWRVTSSVSGGAR
jgi:hypothetical protein